MIYNYECELKTEDSIEILKDIKIWLQRDTKRGDEIIFKILSNIKNLSDDLFEYCFSE